MYLAPGEILTSIACPVSARNIYMLLTICTTLLYTTNGLAVLLHHDKLNQPAGSQNFLNIPVMAKEFSVKFPGHFAGRFSAKNILIVPCVSCAAI